MGINAFLIAVFMYKINISRKVMFMPMFLYILIISANVRSHYAPEEQIALVLFIGCMYMVFKMFKQQDAVEQAFLSSLMLVCASMFISDILWLLPVLWLAYIIERSASWRVYSASLTGVATVFILWLAYLLWIQNPYYLIDALSKTVSRSIPYIHYNMVYYLYLIMNIVLAFIGVANYFSNIYQESTGTRAVLSSLTIAFVVCTGLMLFPDETGSNLFIVMAMLVSSYGSYLFLSGKSIFRSIVYLLLICINIFYFTIISFSLFA